jgi:Na+/proline symporter
MSKCSPSFIAALIVLGLFAAVMLTLAGALS